MKKLPKEFAELFSTLQKPKALSDKQKFGKALLELSKKYPPKKQPHEKT